MSLIDDEESDGCLFVWKIENFSYCWQKYYQKIKSPHFVVKGYEWTLYVQPAFKDLGNRDSVMVVGLKLHSPGQTETKVHFTHSIQAADGSYKKKRNSTFSFSQIHETSELSLLAQDEFLEEGLGAYLCNDTLTLRCRFWKIGETILPAAECYGRTIIVLERHTTILSVTEYLKENNSNETSINQSQVMEPSSPSFSIKLIKSKGNIFAEDSVKVEIKRNDTYPDNPSFATCEITLLKGKDKIIHSVRDEFLFETHFEDSQAWTLPFIVPMSKLVDSQDLYFRLQFAASTGDVHSFIERWENRAVSYCQKIARKRRISEITDDDLDFRMNDDFARLYEDGTLTDLTLRTSTEDFPVHKAILCARSEVFCSIFEHDMKETQTGVVEIKDIDDDTINRMLLFVYSDMVDMEDLDCSSALKLYYAADKYRITALKWKCSDYLKDNIDTLNACDVLRLADHHQDENLKLFVKQFIIDNPQVMGSEEWKKLMEELPKLTSELMHAFFMQN